MATTAAASVLMLGVSGRTGTAAESAVAPTASSGTPGKTAGAGATTPPSPTVTAPSPGPGSDAGPPERAAEVAASGRPIALEIGKGVLIRLPRPASTVFIANPSVADVNVKSPALIYLTAKSVGETALYALDAQDHVLLNSAVRVAAGMEPVRAALHELQSIGLGDDVKANWVNNTLILTGTVATARRAETIRAAATSVAGTVPGSTVLDRLAIATPNQVNIRVKIAEIDRNISKALGFNFSKVGPSNTTFSTALPSTGSLLTYTVPGTGGQLDVMLNALASDGLVKTLAEPNLTVSNNQTANFISGGELFFPTPTAIGTQVTITPEVFGTQLYVTPTILDASHVTLHIRPVISEPSASSPVTINGTSLPSFTQTSAETTVELGSGQTFVLGGLLQELSSETISKIPGLGDIPILGQLFRSESFQKGETELVILVTPYLVEPSSTPLSAPTDGLEWPHDVSQVITGAAYRQTLPPPASGPIAPAGAGLVGTVGFRLD